MIQKSFVNIWLTAARRAITERFLPSTQHYVRQLLVELEMTRQVTLTKEQRNARAKCIIEAAYNVDPEMYPVEDGCLSIFYTLRLLPGISDLAKAGRK